MFGRAFLRPRSYFGRMYVPASPAREVTTSRSVVQLACASIRILKVKPRSSTLAGAEAEMTVSRLKVLRSYARWSLPSSTRVA